MSATARSEQASKRDQSDSGTGPALQPNNKPSFLQKFFGPWNHWEKLLLSLITLVAACEVVWFFYPSFILKPEKGWLQGSLLAIAVVFTIYRYVSVETAREFGKEGEGALKVHVYFQVWFDLVISCVLAVVFVAVLKFDEKQGIFETFSTVDAITGMFLGIVTFLVSHNAETVTTLVRAARALEVTDKVEQATLHIEQSAGKITAEARSMATIQAALTTSVGDLTALADKMNKTTERIEYATIAANALDLKVELLERAHATGGVEMIRFALAQAKSAVMSAPRGTDPNGLQARAWYQLTQSYYQEGIFDLSNNEVVTNARNYAFTILGLIHTLTSKNQEPGTRVVMVNVSPFNPKDLYNWPAGTNDTRYYFETIFFGVYRRAFSQAIASLKNLYPMRIILSAERSDNKKNSRDIGLGWAVDERAFIEKTLQEACIVPTILERLADDPKTAVSRSVPPTDVEVERLREILCRVCKKSFSKRHTAKLLFTPFLSRDASDLDVERPNLKRPLIAFCVDRERWAWSQCLKAVAQLAGDQSDDMLQHLNRIVAVDSGNRPDSAEFSALKERFIRKDSPYTAREFSDLIDLVQDFQHYRIGQPLSLQLVSDAQRADATCRLFKRMLECAGRQVSNHHPDPGLPHASNVGPFEQWLLFLLNKQYTISYQDSDWPVRIGMAFFKDFLSYDMQAFYAGNESAAEAQSKLEQQLRIASLDPQDERSSGTPFVDPSPRPVFETQLVTGEIAPEFVLFGTISGTGPVDLQKVQWVTAVTARMGEPFETCKVKLQFDHQGLGQYSKWVASVFDDQKVLETTRESLGRIFKKV